MAALDYCSFEHKICRIKKDGPGYDEFLLTDNQIIDLAKDTDRFTPIVHDNNLETQALLYEFLDNLSANELISHLEKGGKVLELYTNNQQIFCPYAEDILIEHAQRYLESYGHQLYTIQDGLRIIAEEGEESGFFNPSTVSYLLDEYANRFKPTKLSHSTDWY